MIIKVNLININLKGKNLNVELEKNFSINEKQNKESFCELHLRCVWLVHEEIRG